MASNALVKHGGDVVDIQTGEVLAVAPSFDMADYLATVTTQGAIDAQRKLAAAYDAVCGSLIGDNDVQKEGGRTFKKKSAWRKLARHFSISTDVMRVERDVVGADFLALVTVRARAPWGQSAEAVGACCTDEATGRRVITVADAIATAETRATNRAVSNLIAMGEVSAEEMGGRPAQSDAPRQSGNVGGGKVTAIPFGKHKGQLLTDTDDSELRSIVDWCTEKNKFLDLREACEAEIARRHGGSLLAVETDTEEPLPF